jgi:hypothetical protein
LRVSEETLIDSKTVIASEAKPSRLSAESRKLDRHGPPGLAMTGYIDTYLSIDGMNLGAIVGP